MGYKELKKAAINKDRINDILFLRKNKEYDKIFEIYGQRLYSLAVPNKYRKSDIEKLIGEGRFEDIYRKYGENAYNKYISKMISVDVFNETGSKPKSIINRIKNTVLHRIAPTAISVSLLLPPAAIGYINSSIKQIEVQNAIEYSAEIEEYNEKINTYASEINSMNLTDIQIFMKLMNDLWKNIDGYGNPDQKDVMGYFRLALERENKGVCRHFADDMTAKLNAINPEYNARNIYVNMSDNNYKMANINRNIIESNETVVDNDDKKTSSNEKKLFSVNHAVTAVDIPDKRITLILDPTNLGIGVLKDGKIHIFSTKDGKGLKQNIPSQILLGLDSVISSELSSIQSFLPCEYSLEELENLYGTDAQNKALEQLEKIENNTKKDFIPKAKVDENKAIKEFERSDENIRAEEKEDEIQK